MGDKSDDAGEGKVEVMTLGKLFTQVLDVFGRPSKKFYRALAERATDTVQKAALMELATGDSADAKAKFAARVSETTTFAELLEEFDSAVLTVPDFIALVPRMKARLYSIASSSLANPDKVELLVVLEDWKTPSGKYRMGLSSEYLRDMHPGSQRSLVTASVSSFYLCGQAGRMPSDVYDAIAGGFVTAGKVSLDEARKMLSDMKEEGRYVV